MAVRYCTSPDAVGFDGWNLPMPSPVLHTVNANSSSEHRSTTYITAWPVLELPGAGTDQPPHSTRLSPEASACNRARSVSTATTVALALADLSPADMRDPTPSNSAACCHARAVTHTLHTNAA